MTWARTTAIRTRAARVLGYAKGLAGTRRGAFVLLVAALAVYAFESIGWPLWAGRDLGVYLRYYIQIGQDDPVFPWSMLTRTPVAPLVVGGLLDTGRRRRYRGESHRRPHSLRFGERHGMPGRGQPAEWSAPLE